MSEARTTRDPDQAAIDAKYLDDLYHALVQDHYWGGIEARELIRATVRLIR